MTVFWGKGTLIFKNQSAGHTISGPQISLTYLDFQQNCSIKLLGSTTDQATKLLILHKVFGACTHNITVTPSELVCNQCNYDLPLFSYSA